MTQSTDCTKCGAKMAAVRIRSSLWHCTSCGAQFDVFNTVDTGSNDGDVKSGYAELPVTGSAPVQPDERAGGFAIVALSCPRCGADLDVPENIERLTCRYCGSRLQLVDTGSVRALTLIEKGLNEVAGHAARAAHGVERLHSQNEYRAEQARMNWAAKVVHAQEKVERIESEIADANKKLIIGAILILAGALAAIPGVFISLEAPPSSREVVSWAVFLLCIGLLFVGGLLRVAGGHRRDEKVVELTDAEEELSKWRLREPF